MMLRWITEFSTAVKRSGVSLLPLGGGFWTLPADQAVVAGTATEQDRFIHALPWLVQHGAGAWVPPQDDPFNRTRVFNEDWTLLWGPHSLCERSTNSPPAQRLRGQHLSDVNSRAVQGLVGGVPPLPPPPLAQLYPMKWYEPSSQLGYRSIAKLLSACSALPPALRAINNGGDGLGVASSSVVTNLPPAMFETLASVAGLGRGLNQLWDVLPVPSSLKYRRALHNRRSLTTGDDVHPPCAVGALPCTRGDGPTADWRSGRGSQWEGLHC